MATEKLEPTCWVATGLRTRCASFIDGDQRDECVYPECLPPKAAS